MAALLQSQQETIQMLTNEVARMAAVIQVLQGRLNKNSSNSSKPPSSDGLKKTNSLRQPSGKKPGAQVGHPGSTLEKTATPDITIKHPLPKQCDVCLARLDSTGAQLLKTGQVFDIALPQFEVTEHRTYALQCQCGKRHESALPKGVCEVAQYGANVRALAVHLLHGQMLPYGRTSELLRDLYGVRASTASLVLWSGQAAALVEAQVDAIGQQVQSEAVVHADESGLRVNAKLQWLHTAVTTAYTWYGVHAKRGMQALEEHGILKGYFGTLVHDCWAPYWKLDCEHALCAAHLLRELLYVHESTKQVWSQGLMQTLQAANMACHEARQDDQATLSPEQIEAFTNRYRALVQEGQGHNLATAKAPGQRGRAKQSTTYNLLQRLHEREAQVLRFMHDLRVPFTNNLAERAIRMPKVKQKISGCFRTLPGAQNFCLIRSYLDTARKQGVGMLTALQSAFRGQPMAFA